MIPDNKLVIIHYTGKTQDGQIFDTSRDKMPLRYISNRPPNDVPIIFIDAIKDANKGDILNITWPKHEAFGEYNPYLVKEININELPPGKKVGDILKAISENHGEVFLTIKEIKDGKAVVDANHKLAGKDLYYEVEILDIQDLN
jgi:FKBP-type peptidyl-prolyl cis-trans isomerase SlpA